MKKLEIASLPKERIHAGKIGHDEAHVNRGRRHNPLLLGAIRAPIYGAFIVNASQAIGASAGVRIPEVSRRGRLVIALHKNLAASGCALQGVLSSFAPTAHRGSGNAQIIFASIY
jgi:hypothetical protein